MEPQVEAQMKSSPIILERGEDGGWSAIAPDLPGLLLAAETREELLAQAPGAIADFLDALREQNLPMSTPSFTRLAKMARFGGAILPPPTALRRPPRLRYAPLGVTS
jgi:predicted RNase H-like HicB family nuclease